MEDPGEDHVLYLFGFDLLPRIRNFKDRVFFRPDPEVTWRCGRNTT
jgi:Tn3 transposase DDE domain